MTDEQKQPTSRKRSPGWKDTPEKRSSRQKTRYIRQTEFAINHGFSSWSAFVTALLNGEIQVTKKDA
jgi:hypothetical protein